MAGKLGGEKKVSEAQFKAEARRIERLRLQSILGEISDVIYESQQEEITDRAAVDQIQAILVKGGVR